MSVNTVLLVLSTISCFKYLYSRTSCFVDLCHAVKMCLFFVYAALEIEKASRYFVCVEPFLNLNVDDCFC